MTFGSLFAGIGGFDLGFERAGMTCKWQVEIDPKAQAVLKKHFPNARIYDDVRTIGKHNLAAVDVLCGGFPCQDVSVAGKREGLAGKQSGLWYEFQRVIGEIRPRIVCIENVAGLLSNNEGRDFAAVISGLVELGYGVCWRVLDSRYFGVPQRRRRVFIVGSLGNGSCAEILFERESLRGDSAESGEARKAVAAVAGTLSANGGGTSRPAGNCNELDFCVPVSKCLSAGYGSRQDYETETLLPVAVDQELNASDTFCGCLMKSSPTGGGNQPIVFDPVQITSGTNKSNPQPGDPCHTLHQGGAPAVIAPTLTASNDPSRSPQSSEVTQQVNAIAEATNGYAVRRFTPKETERLQGFPDDWTGDNSDTARYRMTGNAVTVNVAEWIGRRIMEAYA